MPTDSQAFINEYKGRDIDGGGIRYGYWSRIHRCLSCFFSLAIVEQVRDGSAIRVRLLLENGQHQFINLVRLPRLQRPKVGQSVAYGTILMVTGFGWRQVPQGAQRSRWRIQCSVGGV